MKLVIEMFLPFLFFISPIDFAQTNIPLRGKVVDAVTGEALIFANVRVANSTIGSITNKEGLFEIKTLPGAQKLITSFIGYHTDTTEILLDKKRETITIKLLPSSLQLSEVVVFAEENPAYAIIRRAIQRRKERAEKLKSYQYSAYTKGSLKTEDDINARGNTVSIGVGKKDDSTELKITGILENQSTGYYKAPHKLKEIIVARKQSANFPSSVNVLTGGRLLQNFYSDNLNFFGRKMTGPLDDNSAKYYSFTLKDTLAQDNQTIYKIFMTPADSLDPGFIGDIFINGKNFDLVKVNLSLNKAANFSGIFKKILIDQQFDQYDNIYMPVDYHLEVEANVLGLAKFGFELNTLLNNYEINKDIPDDFFNKAVITVLTDADKKDSSYWDTIQRIPNTEEEVTAYKRIDSVAAIPFSFWDEFSWLSNRVTFSKHFSTTGPLGLYHFNRVEGSTLDFRFFFSDLLDDRLQTSFTTSYGFADKRCKSEFSSLYYFGDYRTYSLSFNAFKKTSTLFEKTSSYGDLFSTLSSLLAKYEFNDFYYSHGFSLFASGEVSPILKLKVGLLQQYDQSATKNSEFSIFAKKKKFNANPAISNGLVNAIKAGFTLDFRDYIEDGMFRRRAGNSEGIFILDGDVTIATNKLLKNDFSFALYEASIRGGFSTFNTAGLEFRINGFYNDGSLPFQNFYSLPGNITSLGKAFSFRTLGLNEVVGDRVFTFHLVHNFRDELFRLFGISFLKSLNLQINYFFNAAISDVSTKGKKNLLYQYKAFITPFYENGFSIGHQLFPIALEFSWKINYRGERNFVIGLNSALLN
ncbi:MAG: hypothetical protein COZ80_13275 [Ignavibacteria bacterium CG_4_8_14_3_um_filter_37_9]|nr:carboxypeptidase-like regulatory domain-containing protein [Ignavibacteria bacterium]OIO21866.1 MAG: hypothetical protein AUJ54_04110 [Ignavibacteria bacterium CG1_02_37_35]PIP76173.1 MAG: hypothetical protein COW85_15630 [Ignavibacteria bacterium CG22_combo_CG10-13_8_21_14_all_37_15]PIS45736.1 MAG: hypothetical protein COT22_03685 [Ignavibacteria bacterium CG08_land_8_20_14_0_20_37_9]PIW97919.1 MAG: hypothetical protein COZ80_13275 [Ignavibacteria bacterium CG_4_8_14_3_um_filter_37_9]PIX93